MNKGFSLAALIGIYAALIFDVFSSTNSSPQTTELFASERATSLWRWVKIGAIVSVAFIALAVYIEWRDKESDKNTWLGPLIGGMIALVIMMVMYGYALKAGGGTKPSKQSVSWGYW
jgi:uncharacterized membrane protein YkvI